MENSKQECMPILVSYLKSLTGINPSWNDITDGHEKVQHSNTFSDLLGHEYSSTKNLEIQRSQNKEQPLFHEISNPTAHGPIKIEFSQASGRYLVASRDIDAGDVIFREKPLVLAPKAGVGPTCLKCLKYLGDNWEVCDFCGAPVCSPQCSGDGHSTEECKIIACMTLKSSKDVSIVKLLNILLTPLRTLLLLKDNRFAGEVVAALQSNKETRKRLPMGRFIDEEVVGALHSRIGLNVESDVIHHICGVFDTNAFEVSVDNCRKGRALFPLGAIMNHSCLPNTQHWYKDGELIVRAVTDISAGDSLTNTYTPMILGTRGRAAHLAATKLFRCSCKRCIDPTELGSHISSVVCRACKSAQGLMVPPGESNKDWQCQECGKSLSAMAVETMIRAASSTLSRVPSDDLDALNTTLGHLSKMIGDRHYITTELKYALVSAIMKQPVQDIGDEELDRVVKLTRDLLETASFIDRGFSRFRGIILLERLRASTEQLIRESCTSHLGAESISRDGEEQVANSTNTQELSSKKTDLSEKAKMLLSEAAECEFILLYDLKLEGALEMTNRLRRFLSNS